jgi:hypothetical protein
MTLLDSGRKSTLADLRTHTPTSGIPDVGARECAGCRTLLVSPLTPAKAGVQGYNNGNAVQAALREG